MNKKQPPDIVLGLVMFLSDFFNFFKFFNLMNDSKISKK